MILKTKVKESNDSVVLCWRLNILIREPCEVKVSRTVRRGGYGFHFIVEHSVSTLQNKETLKVVGTLRVP